MLIKIITGLTAFLGIALSACAPNTTVTLPGVASDHPHTVSQDAFLRVLRGNGAPTTNYQQAYRYTVDACNVIMKSRWQDRPQLASTYPASIQDATLRYEVYTAINSNKVCIA